MRQENISGYSEYFYRAVSICNLTPCTRGQRVRKTRKRRRIRRSREEKDREHIYVYTCVRVRKKGRRRNKDGKIERRDGKDSERETRFDLDKAFGYLLHSPEVKIHVSRT